ncbi:unnamed protein product [Amoebophrya sp. A25]|nr:unnamed protein product [Amoebophrya sp. A25]|eukprot:GSA25T00021220001.1
MSTSSEVSSSEGHGSLDEPVEEDDSSPLGGEDASGEEESLPADRDDLEDDDQNKHRHDRTGELDHSVIEEEEENNQHHLEQGPILVEKNNSLGVEEVDLHKVSEPEDPISEQEDEDEARTTGLSTSLFHGYENVDVVGHEKQDDADQAWNSEEPTTSSGLSPREQQQERENNNERDGSAHEQEQDFLVSNFAALSLRCLEESDEIENEEDAEEEIFATAIHAIEHIEPESPLRRRRLSGPTRQDKETTLLMELPACVGDEGQYYQEDFLDCTVKIELQQENQKQVANMNNNYSTTSTGTTTGSSSIPHCRPEGGEARRVSVDSTGAMMSRRRLSEDLFPFDSPSKRQKQTASLAPPQRSRGAVGQLGKEEDDPKNSTNVAENTATCSSSATTGSWSRSVVDVQSQPGLQEDALERVAGTYFREAEESELKATKPSATSASTSGTRKHSPELRPEDEHEGLAVPLEGQHEDIEAEENAIVVGEDEAGNTIAAQKADGEGMLIGGAEESSNENERQRQHVVAAERTHGVEDGDGQEDSAPVLAPEGLPRKNQGSLFPLGAGEGEAESRSRNELDESGEDIDTANEPEPQVQAASSSSFRGDDDSAPRVDDVGATTSFTRLHTEGNDRPPGDSEGAADFVSVEGDGSSSVSGEDDGMRDGAVEENDVVDESIGQSAMEDEPVLFQDVLDELQDVALDLEYDALVLDEDNFDAEQQGELMDAVESDAEESVMGEEVQQLLGEMEDAREDEFEVEFPGNELGDFDFQQQMRDLDSEFDDEGPPGRRVADEAWTDKRCHLSWRYWFSWQRHSLSHSSHNVGQHIVQTDQHNSDLPQDEPRLRYTDHLVDEPQPSSIASYSTKWRERSCTEHPVKKTYGYGRTRGRATVTSFTTSSSSSGPVGGQVQLGSRSSGAQVPARPPSQVLGSLPDMRYTVGPKGPPVNSFALDSCCLSYCALASEVLVYFTPGMKNRRASANVFPQREEDSIRTDHTTTRHVKTEHRTTTAHHDVESKEVFLLARLRVASEEVASRINNILVADGLHVDADERREVIERSQFEFPERMQNQEDLGGTGELGGRGLIRTSRGGEAAGQQEEQQQHQQQLIQPPRTRRKSREVLVVAHDLGVTFFDCSEVRQRIVKEVDSILKESTQLGADRSFGCSTSRTGSTSSYNTNNYSSATGRRDFTSLETQREILSLFCCLDDVESTTTSTENENSRPAPDHVAAVAKVRSRYRVLTHEDVDGLLPLAWRSPDLSFTSHAVLQSCKSTWGLSFRNGLLAASANDHYARIWCPVKQRFQNCHVLPAYLKKQVCGGARKGTEEAWEPEEELDGVRDFKMLFQTSPHHGNIPCVRVGTVVDRTLQKDETMPMPLLEQQVDEPRYVYSAGLDGRICRFEKTTRAAATSKFVVVPTSSTSSEGASNGKGGIDVERKDYTKNEGESATTTEYSNVLWYPGNVRMREGTGNPEHVALLPSDIMDMGRACSSATTLPTGADTTMDTGRSSSTSNAPISSISSCSTDRAARNLFYDTLSSYEGLGYRQWCGPTTTNSTTSFDKKNMRHVQMGFWGFQVVNMGDIPTICMEKQVPEDKRNTSASATVKETSKKVDSEGHHLKTATGDSADVAETGDVVGRASAHDNAKFPEKQDHDRTELNAEGDSSPEEEEPPSKRTRTGRERLLRGSPLPVLANGQQASSVNGQQSSDEQLSNESEDEDLQSARDDESEHYLEDLAPGEEENGPEGQHLWRNKEPPRAHAKAMLTIQFFLKRHNCGARIIADDGEWISFQQWVKEVLMLKVPASFSDAADDIFFNRVSLRRAVRVRWGEEAMREFSKVMDNNRKQLGLCVCPGGNFWIDPAMMPLERCGLDEHLRVEEEKKIVTTEPSRFLVPALAKKCSYFARTRVDVTRHNSSVF